MASEILSPGTSGVASRVSLSETPFQKWRWQKQAYRKHGFLECQQRRLRKHYIQHPFPETVLPGFQKHECRNQVARTLVARLTEAQAPETLYPTPLSRNTTSGMPETWFPLFPEAQILGCGKHGCKSQAAGTSSFRNAQLPERGATYKVS